VQSLRKFYPAIAIDVITTTLKEFAADWNTPHHPIGLSFEDGVRVLRFSTTQPERHDFHQLNGLRLMPQFVDDLWVRGVRRSPINKDEERIYENAMIQSPAMAAFLKKAAADYDFFIFIPYMFGPTFWGAPLVGDRALIIPCLHNERYAYMDLYANVMAQARATIYHVPAEQRLANRLYNLRGKPQLLLGETVDTDPPAGDGERFREKYKIKEPFLLYAGRKIPGKNLPLLVRYFISLKKQARLPEDLKLVIIGGGELSYSRTDYPGIIDLGFVPQQDKYDAYKAALVLIQPSVNESFSIVLMEAWLQGTPVGVIRDCDVTKEHVEAARGGFVFFDGESLAVGIDHLYKDSKLRGELGAAGMAYVRQNYSAEIITQRLVEFLTGLSQAPAHRIFSRLRPGPRRISSPAPAKQTPPSVS